MAEAPAGRRRRRVDPLLEEVRVEEREATAEDAPRPMCSIALCPICAVVTALGEARPELIEHLLLAGREVLLAARAVIDARLEGVERPAPAQRLTID